jgi:hypothetical protein
LPGDDPGHRIIRGGLSPAASPVARLPIRKAVFQVIHYKGITFFNPGPEKPFMGFPLGAKDRQSAQGDSAQGQNGSQEDGQEDQQNGFRTYRDHKVPGFYLFGQSKLAVNCFLMGIIKHVLRGFNRMDILRI